MWQNYRNSTCCSVITHGCADMVTGSYGMSSPREEATARWLMENPDQDPGSDYGVQKRECRDLLHEYAEKHGIDSRFIIIPGVLHTQPMWGGGTTEYALDALDAAVKGTHYTCPVHADEYLPMIHVDDLIAGMLLLMEAPEDKIPAICRGVAMAGFSFTPATLFDEIRKHYPSFSHSYDETSNPSISLFSRTWPDTLSPAEAHECLGFMATKPLGVTVASVIEGHVQRTKL
mmetsp:Transcript_1686/g.3146  ORF Transcript_1686/g.3146 Transcript_1686/m.3146 type:complete len:231 (+) Transcript_1686:445-1137(+)